MANVCKPGGPLTSPCKASVEARKSGQSWDDRSTCKVGTLSYPPGVEESGVNCGVVRVEAHALAQILQPHLGSRTSYSFVSPRIL